MTVKYINNDLAQDGAYIFKDIPWGSHICGIYQSIDDLINMLIPFFKFGLQKNEFCIWITSEFINKNQAKQLLRNYMPEYDYYEGKGQIEILSYEEWYLQSGEFNVTEVLSSWDKKIDEALNKGFLGIRASGDITWLNNIIRPVFQNYESILNNKFNQLKLIAICTYQLSKCTDIELINVINNHKYLLVNNENNFNLISDLDRLERMDVLSKMSASIAHEIRNPITSVKGLLQLLQQKSENKEYADYFNIMIEEIDRANGIISEFLSLAKNKESSPVSESLNDIINKMFPLLQADAIKNGINIILELKEIPMITIEQSDIRQLILNLVRNGMEAMPTGGNLTIRTSMTNGEVVLEVEDEGIGIRPELASKIGLPFFTTKNNGTGLGIAICKNIAMKYNAILDFKTSPGGTTFYVKFKLNNKFKLNKEHDIVYQR